MGGQKSRRGGGALACAKSERRDGTSEKVAWPGEGVGTGKPGRITKKHPSREPVRNRGRANVRDRREFPAHTRTVNG